MAGAAPSFDIPQLPEAKIAIISARWHREICQEMVKGAVRAIGEAGISRFEVIEVAGSFELPLAAKIALESGQDAAIVLGVVVRGETPHFDYVCQGVTDGIMELTLQSGKPIGFGVLTVDSVEQAIARSGAPGSKEDKGYDSAIAALDLLAIKKRFSR